MNLGSLSNEDLAIQLQRADPRKGAAWEELYPRIEKMIHQMIQRVLASVPDGAAGCDYEDLLQVARIQVLECAQRFDRQRGVKFTTYLYQGLWAALVKFIQGQRRSLHQQTEYLQEASEPVVDPVALVLAREVRRQLQQAMQSLSAPARLVCQLRFLEECSIDEIAQTLQMNPQTVKSHIRRSRRFLQQALLEPDPSREQGEAGS